MSKKKNAKNKSIDSTTKEIDLEKDENLEREKGSLEDIDTIKEDDYHEESEVVARLIDNKKKKKNKHILLHCFLVILLLVSVISLGLSIYNKETSVFEIVNNLILTLFTILFVVIGINYNKKKKRIIFICGLLLLGYFVWNFNVLNNVLHISTNNVLDFSGKSLTYVMKWAEANNINVNQEYEYSDMVSEYKVISQDITRGTSLKNLKEITVSISEGPNPYKEVIIPNMVSWNSERVLKFVKNNCLSNVIVEFIQSDKAQDTVIEQNKSGSLKRDDELKLTFSYGEELGYDEVPIVNFVGMSKFEVEFYMKQHQLKYAFDYDFSKKTKRGLVVKQSIKAGKKVKINDEEIKVVISKGPKVKIPNFKGMSMTEVTKWIIKNKLKLEFIEKYDDSVKENEVISANYEEGKFVEQGTVIKITLSRGKLKMPKFKSLDQFREWADKYSVKYEEKHEFSNDVNIGEVISYSYKSGDVIKNDDTIVVTISDGKKCEVPNLKGLTKSEAISKLEKANLKYNFVYKASNDVAKDKVISQSMSAGSEVSSDVTITVTLSNGKKESSSSSKPNSGGSSSSSNSGGSTPTPVCDRSETETVYLYDELLDTTQPSGTCSKVKSRYPKIKFNCVYDKNPGLKSGMIANSSAIDEKELNHCDTYTLKIVSN